MENFQSLAVVGLRFVLRLSLQGGVFPVPAGSPPGFVLLPTSECGLGIWLDPMPALIPSRGRVLLQSAVLLLCGWLEVVHSLWCAAVAGAGGGQTPPTWVCT